MKIKSMKTSRDNFTPNNKETMGIVMARLIRKDLLKNHKTFNEFVF